MSYHKKKSFSSGFFCQYGLHLMFLAVFLSRWQPSRPLSLKTTSSPVYHHDQNFAAVSSTSVYSPTPAFSYLTLAWLCNEFAHHILGDQFSPFLKPSSYTTTHCGSLCSPIPNVHFLFTLF